MNLTEAMKERHSVRQYKKQPLSAEVVSAMNQQKFMFMLEENKVMAKAGKGFYTKLDLGIVKYHFEIGAGKEVFQWT